MYWKQIKRSEHFRKCHEGNLDWNEVIHLIYNTKNKRKKGDKIEIEDGRVYILCEIRNNILYIINVKTK